MDAHRFNDEYDFLLARIDSTFLDFEDHGIPALSLGFDFGGSHQGLGPISMGHRIRDGNGRAGEWCYTSAALLYGIIQRFGAWEKLTGKPVRVLYKHPWSWNASVEGIVGLLSDDALIVADCFVPCEHSR